MLERLSAWTILVVASVAASVIHCAVTELDTRTRARQLALGELVAARREVAVVANSPVALRDKVLDSLSLRMASAGTAAFGSGLRLKLTVGEQGPRVLLERNAAAPGAGPR